MDRDGMKKLLADLDEMLATLKRKVKEMQNADE
jgi:hypothetical protein